MSIRTFPGNSIGQAEALAVGGPKNVTFIPGVGFEVRDGPDYLAPPAPPELSVSAYQLRAALTQRGLRAAVEAAVAAAPLSVKDEWEFKTSYRRNHPTVALIAAAIGKSAADIDDVFALASTIE